MRSCAANLFRYTVFIYSGVLMLSGLMILIASVITFSNIYKYHVFFDEGILSLQLLSMVIGLLTIGIGIYGHWSARKESPKHLKAVFYKFQKFLLIIGIAAVAFESNLGESWRYHYFQRNMEELTPDGIDAWDLMQTDLMCCGIKELFDWSTYSVDQNIPYSCCKDGTECLVSNKNNLFEFGCSKNLKELINYSLAVLMIISLIASCFDIIGMFFSISLISVLESEDNSNNSEKDDEGQEADAVPEDETQPEE
ncbi:tetraspanin-9-like [Condylostylus longicornis]|uniref:tetraspanin-9-like n=1 Tax=Condylostylus longicornis TaxID=2530218 RepID=UPI00244E192A|nr:tetraspanin-9-like [Condylostylus longicornis]